MKKAIFVKKIMKKNLLLFALFFSSFCFSQKETSQTFKSNNETFAYKEIDYSKYGVSQIFVYFYENSKQNTKTPQNAISCLKKEYNLYHTFYYFVEIPKGKTQEEKEIIFADFMKIVTIKNDFKLTDVYLNFDVDYAQKYSDDAQNDSRNNTIKRVVINLTSDAVCRSLHITK